MLDADKVVWNADARHRPELEVEIEIVLPAFEIPGFHVARHQRELEVELDVVVDELEDAWFLSEGDLVPDDDHDAPLPGYTFALAI